MNSAYAITNVLGSRLSFRCVTWLCCFFAAVWAISACQAEETPEGEQLFRESILPLLQSKCVRCHNDKDRLGELSLMRREELIEGGEVGPAIDTEKPLESLLWQQISGESPAMPSGSDPLGPKELSAVQRWLELGAPWPADSVIEHQAEKWWSLKPIERPVVPSVRNAHSTIDAFVLKKLASEDLEQVETADRRTLIRRLYFDLLGLPPSYEESVAFERDTRPDAYERLVDRLLASPRYGERWARHWLDIVHFGETHGYDKDKPRPNAWPYRDYIIRSLNEDRPYGEFVQQQLAGDVFAPGTRDGIEALGFLAAGPWDFIGHAEVPETKIDGQIARHLDRDDMVSTTISTFCSVTAHCAQCHNHKFDPITQEDYYSLQAVFAAIDRADKPYDVDPQVALRRTALQGEVSGLEQELAELDREIAKLGGGELEAIDRQIAVVKNTKDSLPLQHGYHSQIAASQDSVKWVQVDLGSEVSIRRLEWYACHDDFNGIGAGFGYPLRFKIEVSNDATFASGIEMVSDQTEHDFPNPKLAPQQVAIEATARYVRFTATRLAPRQNDFIFALSELKIFDAAGKNVAAKCEVSALDSIEAPIRWGKANLVDEIHPTLASPTETLDQLLADREALLQTKVPENLLSKVATLRSHLTAAQASMAKLPAPQLVYAGTVHSGQGAFRGTGADGGKPRPIHVLARGEVTKPLQLVTPGALSCIDDLPQRFSDTLDTPESARRAALAKWITARENPLTWRSIANRVWQYHFGRAIVDTPNDFGRMGQMPTHPQLLDWLAADIRDEQSLKRLHRSILLSTSYRASSEPAELNSYTQTDPESVDADNQWLWRQNRQRLDAESIRDSMLHIAGLLRFEMGGPSFQDFVIEKPEHSPHYQYQLHDAENPVTHRRSIYRFLVRSQQQPMMSVLDCADPSMLVDKRNQTISPLQALAMLNNQLTLVAAQHFAKRVETLADMPEQQVEIAWQMALSRTPTDEEREVLQQHLQEFGLPSLCRMILNLNELVFAD